MSEPLVLVVLLGAHGDPSTDAVLDATRRALGPEAVVLADTSESTTDEEARAIGERVHARAVARVVWADDEHRVARLHVHVAPSEDWADDELRFSPQDDDSEKARTVGYALASMVRRIDRPPAVAPPPPQPPVAPPAPQPPVAPPASPPPVAPQTRARARALDLRAYGEGALGGGATAVGGGGGLRWWATSRLGLGAAIGARVGTLSSADASTTTLFASAGPAYRAPVGASLELGARADFVLLRHVVTRGASARARWLGAVDLLVEAGWALGPRLGLFVGVGVEVAFGTTTVNVGGVRAADLPPVRGLAELGARIRF